MTAKVRRTETRRLGYAYPVYDRDFEGHLKVLDRWAEDLGGLLTFGRQGLFAHDNTHHALAMAEGAVDSLNVRRLIRSRQVARPSPRVRDPCGRGLRPEMLVLTYHSISDAAGPTSIPPDVFATQMQVLADLGRRSLRLEEFIEWHEGDEWRRRRWRPHHLRRCVRRLRASRRPDPQTAWLFRSGLRPHSAVGASGRMAGRQ